MEALQVALSSQAQLVRLKMDLLFLSVITIWSSPMVVSLSSLWLNSSTLFVNACHQGSLTMTIFHAKLQILVTFHLELKMAATMGPLLL